MGVLALREGLIGEDELLAVLADWQRDPRRPLADVLAERLGEAGRDVASEADKRLAAPAGTDQPPGTVIESVDWQPPPSPTRPTAGQHCRYLRLAEHAKGGL